MCCSEIVVLARRPGLIRVTKYNLYVCRVWLWSESKQRFFYNTALSDPNWIDDSSYTNILKNLSHPKHTRDVSTVETHW